MKTVQAQHETKYHNDIQMFKKQHLSIYTIITTKPKQMTETE